jgi:DNA-binding CsgD family transcriptional regulator
MKALRLDYTEMKRLRDSGMSLARIAAIMGCNEKTVSNAVKKFGWEKRLPGHNRKVDLPKLFRLWYSDMDTADIAVTFGVSLSTLHTLRMRHKLPKRPRATVTLVSDPTPDEIAERARQCRERHFAERRGETDDTTLRWRRSGLA